MRKIVIELDNENNPEITLREVLRLLEGGYSSGINPNWEVVEC